MFPGLYCPGLIEAAPGGSCWCTRSGFRGSIAPASLKPRPRQVGHHGFPAFPGLYCPGLIEAQFQRSDPDRRRGGFRGSIAPASLKPQEVRRADILMLRFRGSIAPASLKRRLSPKPPPGCQAFPGLYCPGLIEAIADYLRKNSGGVVSGALLPRPH